MNTSPITAAQGALLAASAQDMYVPGLLSPELPDGAAADWKLLAHLTAANALFGAQIIGAGERCYYGFLAQSRADENVYIAVIRGTASTLEWIEDAHFMLIPRRSGFVGHGFWSIYSSLRVVDLAGPAANTIAHMLPANASITVIGHSLGAALATYLTHDVADVKRPDLKVHGLFYASPKPGDAAYARAFEAAVGRDNYIVFNALRDVVPRLPPSLPLGMGFQSLMNVALMRPSDSPVRIADNVACSHHATSYAAMLGAQFSPDACILGANP